MKAMILAAGLGTRLKPLTDRKPKALMPIVNKPIIGRTIEYLKRFGIHQIIVNAHHHSEQILDYLDAGRPFGIEIDVRVEARILGTGGGLRNTLNFWDHDAFFVINSDILTNINLDEAYAHHRSSGAMATLILHRCAPFNQIRIDEPYHVNKHHRILDIGRPNIPGGWAFTGIHIIEPELLAHIPATEFSDIIDCYRTLIQAKEQIHAFVDQGHYWHDIGRVESYVQTNKEVLDQNKKTFSIGIDTQIHPSAELSEWAVVGNHAVLEEKAEIRRSILWDHVRVKKGCKITDSIITSGVEVTGDMEGQIL
jgi:mannose-1-phosphate guanylyltransferase